MQREACERHGLKLVEFVLRSREAPDRATVLAARDVFASIEYPAVMHCKSGADRAGLARVFEALEFRTLHQRALRILSFTDTSDHAEPGEGIDRDKVVPVVANGDPAPTTEGSDTDTRKDDTPTA